MARPPQNRDIIIINIVDIEQLSHSLTHSLTLGCTQLIDELEQVVGR